MYLFAGQGTQEKGMLDAVRERFRTEIEDFSRQIGIDFM